MRSCPHPRTSLFLLAPLLVSCATTSLRAPAVAGLPEAEPDPHAFVGIAIPSGVPVTASVIASPAAGMSWDVLACVEHENVVGFVPSRDVDFVNLYLVRQTPAADPSAASRYLVTELWRYRPAAAVKICHRWVTWQDDPRLPPSRAEYSVLIEDLFNRIIEQRTSGIGRDVLGELVRFYAVAVEFFTAHLPPAPPRSARGSVPRDGSGGRPGTGGS